MPPKHVVTDQHMRVMAWVAPRVGLSLELMVPGVGIGVEQGGNLIAGAVFNRITSYSTEFHLAAVPGKTWGTRTFFKVCAEYPFLHLGVNRVTVHTRADNEDARRMTEHMGFKKEGVMRAACRDGSDMIVYGLLKKDCRWIKP